MDRGAEHHVYLIPGLFGFATLAGYDYFGHVETALYERFRDAGVGLRITRVPSLPTSSIAARAAVLAQTVARGRNDGAIHLIGHSSGGLDARLVLSPSTRLAVRGGELDWRAQVRSVVAMNTPHYGTPLSAYFTTVSGTRLLYAVSLLTVITLSVGHLPLTLVESLIEVVRAVDASLGLDIRIIDELTEQLLKFVGARGRMEIRDFMAHLKRDQAGIVQIMPEVSELFNASVEDLAGVRYACTASSAPPPKPRAVLSAVLSPMNALHLAIYTTLYGVASRASELYPYAVASAGQARLLEAGIGRPVGPENVDGVVPTLSMLWGELIWAGRGDHLDVVGHFADDGQPRTHVDWLRSGAGFRRARFASMIDAICGFLLKD